MCMTGRYNPRTIFDYTGGCSGSGISSIAVA